MIYQRKLAVLVGLLAVVGRAVAQLEIETKTCQKALNCQTDCFESCCYTGGTCQTSSTNNCPDGPDSFGNPWPGTLEKQYNYHTQNQGNDGCYCKPKVAGCESTKDVKCWGEVACLGAGYGCTTSNICSVRNA